MSEPTTDAQPELLTITEAAELLRAPVATLRYWRHLGTGPRGFRIGRRVVYLRDDLQTWVDAQRTETAPVSRTNSIYAQEIDSGLATSDRAE